MAKRKSDLEGLPIAALGPMLRGDLENFLVAATPGGIEAQEAREQQKAVSRQRLPRKSNDYGKGPGTWQLLEQLGFVRDPEQLAGGGDDLFIDVVFPKGWTQRPTGHSMWNDVLDDQGRKRLTYFYKGAFYDREAFLGGLETRYGIENVYPEYGSDEDKRHVRRIVVKDRSTGAVLDEQVFVREEASKANNFEPETKYYDKAKAWLDERFADWKNPLAYW